LRRCPADRRRNRRCFRDARPSDLAWACVKRKHKNGHPGGNRRRSAKTKEEEGNPIHAAPQITRLA
jgi:hypothetical protein